MSTALVHDAIVGILDSLSIPYREYQHDPILSYEDAEREQARCGWVGTESKSVFLTDKSGGYVIYATVRGEKVDFARLRELTGVKYSIASEEAVRKVAHCVPGSIPSFGLPIEGLRIFVDATAFEREGDYLFSPGFPDHTFQVDIADMRRVFMHVDAVFLPVITL